MSSVSRTTRIRLGAISFMWGAAACGLLTRTVIFRDVPVIGPWGGDVCWAVAAWYLFRCILPQVFAIEIAVLSAGLCIVVETSQLLDVEWLNTLREHHIIRLLIGHGFMWSDLVLYAIGIAIGWVLDTFVLMRIFGQPHPKSSG